MTCNSSFWSSGIQQREITRCSFSNLRANLQGATQAEATLDLLKVWNLSDRVVALMFDTTASNSGIHKGAAKLMEAHLDRKLPYLACHHHILDLVIGAYGNYCLVTF